MYVVLSLVNIIAAFAFASVEDECAPDEDVPDRVVTGNVNDQLQQSTNMLPMSIIR